MKVAVDHVIGLTVKLLGYPGGPGPSPGMAVCYDKLYSLQLKRKLAGQVFAEGTGILVAVNSPQLFGLVVELLKHLYGDEITSMYHNVGLADLLPDNIGNVSAASWNVCVAYDKELQWPHLPVIDIIPQPVVA